MSRNRKSARLSVVKVPVLPNLIYRFNTIPVKIPACYFVGIAKLILKSAARGDRPEEPTQDWRRAKLEEQVFRNISHLESLYLLNRWSQQAVHLWRDRFCHRPVWLKLSAACLNDPLRPPPPHQPGIHPRAFPWGGGHVLFVWKQSTYRCVSTCGDHTSDSAMTSHLKRMTVNTKILLLADLGLRIHSVKQSSPYNIANL